MNTPAPTLETTFPPFKGIEISLEMGTAESPDLPGVLPFPTIDASLVLLAPAAKQGRALLPNELLSSESPLVLVHVASDGKETVLPGYYACVGKMPCAEKDYHLLVRWEQRESKQRSEKRVVLPEAIRVMERETLPA